MLKRFFLRLVSPFHLILPLVGFGAMLLVLIGRNVFMDTQKFRPQKDVIHPVLDTKKKSVHSLMSNMHVADKATV